MSTDASTPDVVIVGGGVIGLSVGWRAARRGLKVTIVERGDPGAATSWVAAGMIAPIAEAEPTERPLLELDPSQRRGLSAFVEELQADSGLDPRYLRCGTLMVARDPDEAAVLSRELAMRTELGLPVASADAVGGPAARAGTGADAARRAPRSRATARSTRGR